MPDHEVQGQNEAESILACGYPDVKNFKRRQV